MSEPKQLFNATGQGLIHEAHANLIAAIQNNEDVNLSCTKFDRLCQTEAMQAIHNAANVANLAEIAVRLRDTVHGYIQNAAETAYTAKCNDANTADVQAGLTAAFNYIGNDNAMGAIQKIQLEHGPGTNSK